MCDKAIQRVLLNPDYSLLSYLLTGFILRRYASVELDLVCIYYAFAAPKPDLG